MPHRLIPSLDALRAIFAALYEPAIYYLAAISAAFAAVSLPPESVIAGVRGHWMELFGFFMGTVADLWARGRAYAALPSEQRASRLTEWKGRLGLAAIGLGVGILAAYAINGILAATYPGVAVWLFPFANLICVTIAVPVIDLIRFTARKLGGRSTSDALAGLVIAWASRRAGAGDK